MDYANLLVAQIQVVPMRTGSAGVLEWWSTARTGLHVGTS